MTAEPTTAVHLAEPDEPALEAEYRRGYRDGFIEALNSLEARHGRGGWARAADAAWDHWSGPLRTWARADCRTLVEPPALGTYRASPGEHGRPA